LEWRNSERGGVVGVKEWLKRRRYWGGGIVEVEEGVEWRKG